MSAEFFGAEKIDIWIDGTIRNEFTSCLYTAYYYSNWQICLPFKMSVIFEIYNIPLNKIERLSDFWIRL